MSSLSDLSQALLVMLPTYGYAVLAAATLIGAVGLPIPTTFLLMAAGALTADGGLSFPPVVVTALGAAVAGDCTGYVIGRHAGRPLLERTGPHLGLTLQRRERIERSFGRWGGGMVWLTRWLFTAAGPAINILAGVNRYTFGSFLAFDLFGEALWSSAYVGLGWFFGDNWTELEDFTGNLLWFLGAGVAAVILAVVAWRLLRRPQSTAPPAAAQSPTFRRDALHVPGK